MKINKRTSIMKRFIKTNEMEQWQFNTYIKGTRRRIEFSEKDKLCARP